MSEMESELNAQIKEAKWRVRLEEDDIRDAELHQRLQQAELRVLELQATKKRFEISDSVKDRDAWKDDLMRYLTELRALEELAAKEGEG